MSTRVDELRRAFDEAFTREVAAPEPSVALLAIEVGGEAMTVAVADVASVQRLANVRALPGAPRELLGLAGLRGRVLPVYDLGALLGRASEASTLRWIVCVGAPMVGLAFAQLEGQRRIPQREISPPPPGARFARGVVRVDGALRTLVDLPSVAEDLRTRSRGP